MSEILTLDQLADLIKSNDNRGIELARYVGRDVIPFNWRQEALAWERRDKQMSKRARNPQDMCREVEKFERELFDYRCMMREDNWTPSYDLPLLKLEHCPCDCVKCEQLPTKTFVGGFPDVAEKPAVEPEEASVTRVDAVVPAVQPTPEKVVVDPPVVEEVTESVVLDKPEPFESLEL